MNDRSTVHKSHLIRSCWRVDSSFTVTILRKIVNKSVFHSNCVGCKEGHYGINCRLVCGHCAGNVNCDVVNGSCPFGYCEAGWKQTPDRKCDQGMYWTFKYFYPFK